MCCVHVSADIIYVFTAGFFLRCGIVLHAAFESVRVCALLYFFRNSIIGEWRSCAHAATTASFIFVQKHDAHK